jgi:hypothetical protein
MIICDRCGWLIPTDCTCRRQLDQLSVLRLKHDVADRHRQSVARAHRSGWPVRSALVEPEGRAARTAHGPATFQPPDESERRSDRDRVRDSPDGDDDAGVSATRRDARVRRQRERSSRRPPQALPR